MAGDLTRIRWPDQVDMTIGFDDFAVHLERIVSPPFYIAFST
jgi:hypothetical protein